MAILKSPIDKDIVLQIFNSCKRRGVVACCEGEDHLSVSKRAWSAARCPKRGFDGIVYRCACGALILMEFARVIGCDCGLGVHYCRDVVRPLSQFNDGEHCEGCGKTPTSGLDDNAPMACYSDEPDEDTLQAESDENKSQL